MPGDGRDLEAVVLSREGILRALTRQPSTKRELTDAVSSSRSTVDRAIRELLDVGLVTHRDGRYEATMPARCALDTVESFHDRMSGVTDAVAVLEELPSDTPLDPVFITGSEIHLTTPEMPDSVIQRLFESVESASHLRGVAPVVLSGHLEPFYDAATAGGARVEMVIDDDVLDQMFDSLSTRDVLLSQLEDEHVTISHVDVPFSFGLWLTESEAGVVVYTDTGVRGILVNDGDAAYSWAEARFEELAAQATELTAAAAETGDE